MHIKEIVFPACEVCLRQVNWSYHILNRIEIVFSDSKKLQSQELSCLNIGTARARWMREASGTRLTACVHSVTAFFFFQMRPNGYGIDRRCRRLIVGLCWDRTGECVLSQTASPSKYQHLVRMEPAAGVRRAGHNGHSGSPGGGWLSESPWVPLSQSLC